MLPQPHLVAKLFFSARGGGSQSGSYNICYIYRSGGSYRPFIVIEVNCSIYRDIDFRPYRPALVCGEKQTLLMFFSISYLNCVGQWSHQFIMNQEIILHFSIA